MALGVERELSGREMIDPVVLLMVTEHPEVGFDLLVLSFDFTVALWVVSRGETGFNAEVFVQSSHETCSKLGSAV